METKSVQTRKEIINDKTVLTETDAADADEIMEMSKEYEKYPCFYCEKEIRSEVHLIEHRVTCPGATDNPSLFSFPIRSVPLLYKCGICGLVGSCKADILYHKKIMHGNHSGS